MESIPKNKLLCYQLDTLQYLRNKYGFDTIKRVNDAINALEEWIAKQEHFVKKHFDRNYLERLLIYNKGSVEKCKTKLDKLCTMRTFIPECFSMEIIDKELFFGSYSDALLSQMTSDHGRVHFVQFNGRNFNTQTISSYCHYLILIYQYIQMKDYCSHVTLIVHWQEGNVFEFIKALDLSLFRKAVELSFEAFSLRINAMHFVTEYKTIDVFINILKSILSTKIGERIHIHNTMETVYDYVPRHIFPKDYGGDDKPMSQLREELYNELFSTEFTEYRREMNKACTNEALRQNDKINEDYLGMPGTFRALSVD